MSFRLFAADLDPDAVTALLGVTPTKARRRGEPMGQSGFPSRTGAWLLHAVRREPGDLDAQLRELCAQLPSDPEIWQQLGDEVERSLFCGLFMEETNCGLSIEPSTLERIARLGARLDLDVYAPTEDEDG